jgi:hypothetical protein
MTPEQLNTAIQLSPPYWIPFLIALAMVLAFLGVVMVQIFKIVIRPLLHTLDQVNETLVGLTQTNGRLVEKMAIMIDRGQNGHDRRRLSDA